MTSTVMSQPMMTSAGPELGEAASPSKRSVSDLWFYVVGVVCGGLSLVGIAANCLTVMLWSGRETRRYPCVPYFMALAVYDTLFLLCLVCFTCSLQIFRQLAIASQAIVYFYQPAGVFYPFFMNVVTFGSVYTTACLATDRCLAVVRPLTWPQTRSAKMANVVLVLVLAWSIVVNVPVAMEGSLAWVYDPKRNETFLQFVPSEFCFDYFHIHVYRRYLFPAVSFVIPVVSILVINFILVYKVCTRGRSLIGAGMSSAAVSSKRQAAAYSEAQSLTWQVIVISFLTLLSRFLTTVVDMWMAVLETIMLSHCTYECMAMSAFGILTLVINASANFFLYLYFTRTFRQLFLQRFPCWAKRCGQRSYRQGEASVERSVSVSVVKVP